MVNQTEHITANDSSHIVKDNTFPSVATVSAGIPVGGCVVGNLIDLSDADEPALAPPPPHPSWLIDLASVTSWSTPAVEIANTTPAHNAEGMLPVLKSLKESKEEWEKTPSMESDSQKVIDQSKEISWVIERALKSSKQNVDQASKPLKR